ncbi:hypothetical protein HanOQP8_Chr01g0000211 [Helianthus annuus]|nr:hypothetical protein HanOQP8_Chr01g0000211 [Helianthus annuus]
MANKSNVPGCFNILNRNGLEWYVSQYAIPASLNPILPKKDTAIYPFVPGKIGVYTRMFDYYNYHLPLTKFLVEVLMFHERSRLPDPLPEDFKFNRGLYAALIKEADRVQKFPEHILVMGRINKIWSEQEYYPTLKWNGKVMGLKEALRLKSFDSTELDIRATRTPKGDPPYLSVVRENLYLIRETAATTGQGGSSSAPLAQATNVIPVQAALVVSGDKGKRTG